MAQIGYRPIPAFNVANGCATGAVALRLCIQSILAGEASMALAVGAQVMGKPVCSAMRVEEARTSQALHPTRSLGHGDEYRRENRHRHLPGTFSHAGMSTRSRTTSPSTSSPKSRSRTTSTRD